MLERELYHPIKKNYTKRFRLYEEIRLYSRIIDLLLFDKNKSKTIIAMEFKLKDWKKAFIQAFTYLLIANYVYIVLYHKNIKNVDKDLLKINGIGLISATKNRYRIILKPKKNNKIDKTLLNIILNEIKQRDVNLG